VLGVAAGLVLCLEMRDDLSRTGDPLARTAASLADRIDAARPADARTVLTASGVAARRLGPAGRVRIQTGDGALWSAGAPSRIGALATGGVDGWTLRGGALEARRPLASGGALVLRAPLPPGAGAVGSATAILIAIVVLSLLAAALAWHLGARAGRRLHRLTVAVEAASGTRPGALASDGRGAWSRLSQAIEAATERTAALQSAAEAGIGALGTALAPLAHPVAARTPSGGLVRNDALERLVGALAPQDAAQVDDAVRMGLTSSGPVSRRVALSDGRALEVEGWAVPGGRVAAVGERTEQARMEAVRRQMTGAAARHLRAPVSEIQALGSDLLGHVAPSAVTTVRRIQAAGDRMERLVSQMLRGTANDPRADPLRLRAVGVAGLAYGLGTAFDRRLRDRGLRLETDLPGDLPPVRTDAALAHEILTELIANAATFTPRGGTITLSGRALPGGRVELTVLDTGPGIRPDELGVVGERFARGAGASGFPGAGLGLGVARALAERIGGRLSLVAGPGGRARLELPAALVPVATGEQPPHDAGIAAEAAPAVAS
jgi:signal transduction histidine kinase